MLNCIWLPSTLASHVKASYDSWSLFRDMILDHVFRDMILLDPFDWIRAWEVFSRLGLCTAIVVTGKTCL